MRSRFGFASQVLLILALLLPGVALAVEVKSPTEELEKPLKAGKEPGALRLGPVDVHPYVSLAEAYTDNVFATNNLQQHDWKMIFAPGIYLQVPVRQHILSFNANTTLTRYSKFTSQNTDDYKLGADGNFNLGSRLNVKVSDVYTRGHEDAANASAGRIERFYNNNAYVSATYMLAEVSKVQLDYTRANWDYDTQNFRDRVEDLISAYLYYRLMPKTSAFIQYNFKNVRYSASDTFIDNKVNSALLGVAWELSAKSKGTVAGGFLVKDYKDPSLGTLRTWTGYADIDHAFSDFTSMKILGKRDAIEASMPGTRYYIATSLSGELTHRFLNRLSGSVRISYEEDKYSDIIPGDPQLRKDKIFNAGGSLRYALLRWLDLILDYNYRDTNSNVDTYSSRENVIAVKANAVF